MLIEERTADDPGLSALLDAAFAELVTRYGAEGRSLVHAAARYLVASFAGQPAGCVALQPAGPTTGELKRMYVSPEFRGRGIGRALLTELEELASGLGYARIRLATGVRQPEAIALYERSGYSLTPPYGKYVNDPLCRCYEKTIANPCG